VLGLRKQVSYLLSKGHSDAWWYPIGMALDEAAICRERDATDMVEYMGLLRVMIAGVMSEEGSKEATKVLEGMIAEAKVWPPRNEM